MHTTYRHAQSRSTQGYSWIPLAYKCTAVLFLCTGTEVRSPERESFIPHSYQRLFSSKTYEPSQPLLSLLSLLNIKHDGSLKSIVDATQKEWLRAPGTERWQMDEIAIAKRDELIQLLNTLGCIEEVTPSRMEYDYALVLGAATPRVQLRFNYLITLWNSGVRFKTIVFLGGQRPLDPTVDAIAWDQTAPTPTTEYDMMRYVFEHTKLPEGFDQLPIIFVNTPMQSTPDGKIRRPNTFDIVQQWISSNPIPGTCLAVSNQPYVGFQDTAVRTALPFSFPLETVGQTVRAHELMSIHLDNLARWLYQEYQLSLKK